MTGSFVDAAVEDQRVDARAEVLLRLAQEYGTSFWSSPAPVFGLLQIKPAKLSGFRIAPPKCGNISASAPKP
jgi:hypothetical protein